MTAKFNKRLAFIALVLNAKIANAKLANEWYIQNNGAKLDNDEALRRFREWVR